MQGFQPTYGAPGGAGNGLGYGMPSPPGQGDPVQSPFGAPGNPSPFNMQLPDPDANRRRREKLAQMMLQRYGQQSQAASSRPIYGGVRPSWPTGQRPILGSQAWGLSHMPDQAQGLPGGPGGQGGGPPRPVGYSTPAADPLGAPALFNGNLSQLDFNQIINQMPSQGSPLYRPTGGLNPVRGLFGSR